MWLVYSNATVVISASRACSANEGFLGPRIPSGSDRPHEVFRLGYRRAEVQAGSVVPVPECPSRNEPTDERAWTLQERVLAAGFLDYGTLQTRWFCRSVDQSKVPADGWAEKASENQFRNDRIFTYTLQVVSGTAL